jgi:hypothetical protein
LTARACDGFPPPAVGASRYNGDRHMNELAVVCTLGPETLKIRREGLLAKLLQRVESHELLADGHRLRFAVSDDVLPLIATTIDAERKCCRFLRFQLTIEPASGPIVLDLTGPPGTQEFVAALFASS